MTRVAESHQTECEELVAACGGLTEMSRKLGGIPVTTIDAWQRNNRLPKWRLPAVIEMVEQHEIVLSARVRKMLGLTRRAA